jgi:hypothetical protein
MLMGGKTEWFVLSKTASFQSLLRLRWFLVQISVSIHNVSAFCTPSRIIRCKGKGKVSPVHAIKEFWGKGGMEPVILNFVCRLGRNRMQMLDYKIY